MEWTRTERYRKLEDTSPEELSELTAKVAHCPWRQSFHIQPETGLLNDPNGFAYYEGEYHLFYQWFPLGPVHGLKYWYHTKSKDLVHWENAGVGIRPGGAFDSHGAYSGSGIVHDGLLYLMYTGNTRDEQWERRPYQCMAVMRPDGSISKFEAPLVSGAPDGYTEHFRDPKVWEEDGTFYAVIGAQRKDHTGCALLYQSSDLKRWSFAGEIKTSPKLRSFGYMWECPDYFELDGSGVLMFCPQGIEADGERFRNIYQAGYVAGEKLNPDSRELKHGAFHELDRGFDFYASQTTLAPDGRRIMIGWMGLPDIACPTDSYGWAHCLSLPRELRLLDGKLRQLPVQELRALRGQESFAEGELNAESISPKGFAGTRYEMICEFENRDARSFGLAFRSGNGQRTVLSCDSIQGRLTLDRTLSGAPVAAEYGTVRSCAVDAERLKLHLFVDTSSVEVFVNDGEEVFTARIFPDQGSKGISLFASGGQAVYKASKWDY
ncbi:glycoside hydrolase family 32 protein [Paenibacillus caui]|uniref:glycoside hydrolase family 32 protein n=1 Tax=Paenibacillus caui TaxID=2873927 RepID=UPI001CA9D9CE|nr:sucrose-6-phosphate hydrolase [Paenibacillus caui]